MGNSNRWACEVSGEYPDNWSDISYACKQAENFTCEHCGMEFHQNSKAKTHLNSDGKPSILTVHHLNGNKADCHHENLLVCCQACHLKIQGSWSPGMVLPLAWIDPPQWLTKRNLPYQASTQMRLF